MIIRARPVKIKSYEPVQNLLIPVREESSRTQEKETLAPSRKRKKLK